METGDLQAELTVATVAHNFAPFQPGNDFFDVAESVPGLVNSEKESCAQSTGVGYVCEVTWASGGIGESLLNSSVAVKLAAFGAGMAVTSSCSSGAQGKCLREELEKASSCPVIICLLEGNVPPVIRRPSQLLTARKFKVIRGQALFWSAQKHVPQ
ncbi:unnamed protein product [Caretta caretta]